MPRKQQTTFKEVVDTMDLTRVRLVTLKDFITQQFVEVPNVVLAQMIGVNELTVAVMNDTKTKVELVDGAFSRVIHNEDPVPPPEPIDTSPINPLEDEEDDEPEPSDDEFANDPDMEPDDE